MNREPETSTAAGSPTPSRNLPRRLSPAALNRYRSCPQQFLWFDVERRYPKQQPSPALAQGNAVHHALERFFGLRPEQRSLEMLGRALRHVWPQHRDGVFASRDEEIHYGRDALELLRMFYESFDAQAIPLAREQWLSVRLANGFVLYGKADRIDRGPGGGAIVIDYKTGRRGELDARDLARDSAAQVYSLAVQAESGLDIEAVRLLFLRDCEEVCWTPEVDDVEAAGERLTAVIETIRQDQAFAAVPGPACRICRFQVLCPDRTRVEADDLAVAERLPF